MKGVTSRKRHSKVTREFDENENTCVVMLLLNLHHCPLSSCLQPCNLVFDRVSFESIPHSHNADGCANPRTNSEFRLLVPGCNVQELLL